MRESKRLVDTVKRQLKQQGKTYADLTDVLDLSHASVKRLFAEKNFTLERLEKVCNFLGTDLADLIRLMEKNEEKIDQLTLEQEKEFVDDTRFLCFAHALLQRWSFDEIIETYEISEHEGIQMMARLDRMKLIEMLPGNRYKLLISRNFNWIKSGPIQNFFERQLQADYFETKFNKPDELRIFVSSMLSASSLEAIMAKMGKLAGEVNDCHLEDEKLPLERKQGISMVLAIRPWETKVFTALRRDRKPVN